MLDPNVGIALVDTNPKTQVGRSKPDLSLVPPVALAHEADAFMDGAFKYGPYNWRDKTVSIRTYIAAALRHIGQFQDGELVASDSNVHHLGHARACLGIILDAMSVGNAIDDRPTAGAVGAAIEQIKERRSEATPTAPAPQPGEVIVIPADVRPADWPSTGGQPRHWPSTSRHRQCE